MNEQGTNSGELIIWDRIKGTVNTKNPRTTINPSGSGDQGPAKTNVPKTKAIGIPQ